MTTRLVGPDGQPLHKPDLSQLQQQAIQQQLNTGAAALRMLAVFLAEIPERKRVIPKMLIEKIKLDYPNSVLRFGEDLDSYTISLQTPEELDAADKEIARVRAEQQDTVEDLVDGASRPT